MLGNSPVEDLLHRSGDVCQLLGTLTKMLRKRRMRYITLIAGRPLGTPQLASAYGSARFARSANGYAPLRLAPLGVARWHVDTARWPLASASSGVTLHLGVSSLLL